MTGRPSDVVPKIRPQTFYPYSVRRILRANERKVVEADNKSPAVFILARIESFNEEKKKGNVSEPLTPCTRS